MKCLSIQVQAGRDASHTVQELVEHVKVVLARFPEIDRDEEDEQTVQLHFFSEDIPLLWQQLQEKLFQDSVLGSWAKNVSIVVCEAEGDEMLLLSHFDQSEALDSL